MLVTTMKTIFATALISGLAEATEYRKVHDAAPGLLFRRQAFDPDEEYGRGDTCAEAFGAGYIQCVAETVTEAPLCVNPDIGDSCCENLWGCPSGSFCLVQDLCCPDEYTAAECGLANSVSIPDDFTPSTAPAIPETTAVEADTTTAVEEEESEATTTADFGSDDDAITTETTPLVGVPTDDATDAATTTAVVTQIGTSAAAPQERVGGIFAAAAALMAVFI